MLTRAIIAAGAVIAVSACGASDAAVEVCDATRAVCPRLRRLVSSPARISGDLQYRIAYTPLVTDTTLWRVDVFLQNVTRDTVVITPTGSQACEGYLVVGFWDNASYVGKPRLSYPEFRRTPDTPCFLEPNEPVSIPPGATFVNLIFRRAGITDSFLRWQSTATELWPAMLVSSDRGDVVVTAPPRRIRP